MKKLYNIVFFYFLSILLFSFITHGQTTNQTFSVDSLKIQKTISKGYGGELVLKNSTSGVTGGVLTNMGNGKTAFVLSTASGSTIYTAGNGISISGTNQIVNTSPDRILTLTGAGTLSISGNYPNYTITSSLPAQQLISILGINGTTVTGSGYSYTINSQNLINDNLTSAIDKTYSIDKILALIVASTPDLSSYATITYVDGQITNLYNAVYSDYTNQVNTLAANTLPATLYNPFVGGDYVAPYLTRFTGGIVTPIIYGGYLYSAPTLTIDLANETIQAQDGGGATTGFINVGTRTLSVGDWKADADYSGSYSNLSFTNKGYVTSLLANKLDKIGGTLTGDLSFNSGLKINATTLRIGSSGFGNGLIGLDVNATGSTPSVLMQVGQYFSNPPSAYSWQTGIKVNRGQVDVVGYDTDPALSFKGIVYPSDISNTLQPLSLIHKSYLDSRLSTISGISQNSSITGINGIAINQLGQAFSVSGASLVNTIVGLNITVNQIGQAFTLTGLSQSITTLIGINGATVTGANNNYTINGRNFTAGASISISGTNQIINTSPNILVTLTGLNNITVSGSANRFSIAGQNLVAGNNITITGNSIIGNTPSTSFMINSPEFFDEFVNLNDWGINVSGSGASGNTTNLGATSVAVLNLGVATNGQASLRRGQNNNLALGIGNQQIITSLQLGALSTVTDEYTVYSGLADSQTSDPIDGVYFRYQRTVGGDFWQAVTSSNSTRTVVTTSAAITANSWMKLAFIVNAAGTSVDFFVNGTNVATITTNIPTGSVRLTNENLSAVKTAGTTATFIYSDYWFNRLDLTAVR